MSTNNSWSRTGS